MIRNVACVARHGTSALACLLAVASIAGQAAQAEVSRCPVGIVAPCYSLVGYPREEVQAFAAEASQPDGVVIVHFGREARYTAQAERVIFDLIETESPGEATDRFLLVVSDGAEEVQVFVGGAAMTDPVDMVRTYADVASLVRAARDRFAAEQARVAAEEEARRAMEEARRAAEEARDAEIRDQEERRKVAL